MKQIFKEEREMLMSSLKIVQMPAVDWGGGRWRNTSTLTTTLFPS
jgi:hypothetical protein